MNNLKIFGKFLDQPILISKLNKAMPSIMALGGGALFLNNAIDTFEKSEDKKNAQKETVKKGIILTSAIISALLAPKIASKITKRPPLESLAEIKAKNEELINKFISKNNLDLETTKLLNKAKKEVLDFSELKKLFNKIKNEKFINELIPEPENIKAKDIFSEIGFLSTYGAVPVIGGITGGIVADYITEKEKAKEQIPDKINEGLYQYLANIFMCNIGAGGALAILEKLNIKSKSARAIGMVSGIILTGVIGGSKLANLVSQKIINPILSPNKKLKERKPEALDVCLHTDDIATVSLLSGLKWIEPALPILYSVSGYKAGIGYRN